MSFPKLRYPINTFKLTDDDRNQLLAYDIIFRLMNQIRGSEEFHKIEILNENDRLDAEANLTNLGHHIEEVICAGDASLRFEEEIK